MSRRRRFAILAYTAMSTPCDFVGLDGVSTHGQECVVGLYGRETFLYWPTAKQFIEQRETFLRQFEAWRKLSGNQVSGISDKSR